MNPTKMAEKQRFLARAASAHPDHRFTNLYDLLRWDYWMHISAERVLARPGSQTDGVDGQTRIAFKADYERQMTVLIDQLKRRTYKPQPVRRVYIPKHDGKRRDRSCTRRCSEVIMRVRVRDDVAQSKIVDEPPAVTGRRLAKGY